MNYTEQHIQQALALACAVAPNGRIQQAFGELVNRMKSDGRAPRAIIAEVLSQTTDGMMHSVWPAKGVTPGSSSGE